jgi:hypothetical protein
MSMSELIAQEAKVVRLSELLEEEVVLSVHGIEIVCFVGACPYKLKEGDSYPVKLGLLILEDYNVEELEDDVEQFLSRKGNGFAYRMQGRLIDGYLDVHGVKFENGAFESEYAYI